MNPGDLIGGKYRLVRQIGEGAMGVVWSAVNELTTGEVALKLMLRPSDDLRHRLLRKARACGSLSHRHIVKVYDVGQTDSGDPFLVMQLLSGETLAELLARQRRLDPALAMQIARDVARALDAAHAATIIHRDLKPANIFLHHEAGTEGTIVKVLDFGVSKNLSATDDVSTVAGRPVGSPAYMSPEQIRVDRTLDHRTDIWSLGVILFEMLTGVRPFKGTGQELIQNILTAEIPQVSRLVRFTDPTLVGLISRCLERDRDKRIASAADLAQSLQGQASSEPSGVPASMPQRPSAASWPSYPAGAPLGPVQVAPVQPVQVDEANAGYGAPSHGPAAITVPISQGGTSALAAQDARGSDLRGSSPAIARATPMPDAPTEKLPPAAGLRAPEGAGAAGEYTKSGTLKLSGLAADAMGAALRERLSGSTTSAAAVVQSSGASASGQQRASQSGASSDGARSSRTAWVIAGVSVLVALAGGGFYVLRSPTAARPAAAEAPATPPETARAPAAQPGASAGAIADGSHLTGPAPATSSDPAIASAVPGKPRGRAPGDNGFYEDIDGDVTYGGPDRKPQPVPPGTVPPSGSAGKSPALKPARHLS